MYTIKWRELYKPISDWELGIKQPRDDNLPQIAKDYWDINDRNLLCLKNLKAICYQNKPLWNENYEKRKFLILERVFLKYLNLQILM